MKLTHEQFRTIWQEMSESQKERVKSKARWEHMTLWAVLQEWPTLMEKEATV